MASNYDSEHFRHSGGVLWLYTVPWGLSRPQIRDHGGLPLARRIDSSHCASSCLWRQDCGQDMEAQQLSKGQGNLIVPKSDRNLKHFVALYSRVLLLSSSRRFILLSPALSTTLDTPSLRARTKHFIQELGVFWAGVSFRNPTPGTTHVRRLNSSPSPAFVAALGSCQLCPRPMISV